MGYIWIKWEEIQGVLEKIVDTNALDITKIINREGKRWVDKCS